MHTIILIGAGNIGRRHLQGLVLSPLPYTIYIVDTQPHCLELAADAVSEVNHSNVALHQFHYLTSMAHLPKTCDVAIVATNADVRKVVCEQLLEQVAPKYLILEKVLFQQEADYKTIGQLLYKRGIPCFVNCTRRYYSHYQKIAKLIQAAESEELFKQGLHALSKDAKSGLQFSMTVNGSNWGLACNTIHLLDLFQFMNGHATYEFSIDLLDDKVLEAKRAGFIELSGTLAASSDSNYAFSATSATQTGLPLTISLQAGKYLFSINETAGSVDYTIAASADQAAQTGSIAYAALPLSQAAHLFVNDLITTGTCALTNYFVSAQLHLCLLKAYATFLGNRIDISKGVPIT